MEWGEAEVRRLQIVLEHFIPKLFPNLQPADHADIVQQSVMLGLAFQKRFPVIDLRHAQRLAKSSAIHLGLLKHRVKPQPDLVPASEAKYGVQAPDFEFGLDAVQENIVHIADYKIRHNRKNDVISSI